MEINILAFIATILFILIPITFEGILYVQIVNQGSWLEIWINRYTTTVERNLYRKINSFQI
jgi:photosystem II reaction center protein PsbM